jgi:predicted nucleic acid-binding protein
MIFVDSNVFVIALRYRRDRNARANAAFLARLRDRGDAVTSVVNLLEVCGILSFNLSERQLRALYRHFARRFSVRIVPEDRDGRAVMPATPSEVLALMTARMSLGDALVASALLRWAPAAESFVSWDAKHFEGRLPARVVTPVQFLERRNA